MKSFEDLENEVKQAAKNSALDCFNMMFPQDMCKLAFSNNKESEIFTSIWGCALMIEKYHYSVYRREISDTTRFNDDDRNLWKNKYYPELVKTKVIHDTDFFDPKESNFNIGVGMNGTFNRIEYINLRYQLYKVLYETYMNQNWFKTMLSSSPLYTCLNNAITMIQPYIKKFNPSNSKELFTFQQTDMKMWTEHYFPILVETGFINDYTIVDPIAMRKAYGIGTDGIAFCWEMQYFVSEAYKAILLPLYIQLNCPIP